MALPGVSPSGPQPCGPWVLTQGNNSTTGRGHVDEALDEWAIYDAPAAVPSPDLQAAEPLELADERSAATELRAELVERLLDAAVGHEDRAYLQREARLLEGCGADTLVLVCPRGTPHPTLVRCDRRTCPVCLRARAARLRDELGAHVARLLRQGYRVAHATFTRPQLAGETLAAASTSTTDAFRDLMRARSIRERVPGAYRSLEYEPRADGSWHVHLHVALVLVGRTPWRELLADLTMGWHGRTGCSVRCDRKVASLGATGAGTGCKAGGSVVVGDIHGRDADPDRVAREVCKYPVKATSVLGLPPAMLAEGVMVLRGRRLSQGYGMMRFRRPSEECAPCDCCIEHNAAALATLPTELAYAECVDPLRRVYVGPLSLVRRRAAEADDDALRIVAYLLQHHPRLFRGPP